MLGVRLPQELDRRLGLLAEKTNRSKSFYVKEALEAYLDDYEQILAAVSEYEEQARKGTLKTYSLEEVMKRANLTKLDSFVERA